MTKRRVQVCRAIAIVADIIQIAVFPVFSEGALSPINDALDALVGAIMVFLLGWHWAFLPTAVAELIPGLDLVPSWTAAVFLVTRGKNFSNGPQNAENRHVVDMPAEAIEGIPERAGDTCKLGK